MAFGVNCGPHPGPLKKTIADIASNCICTIFEGIEHYVNRLMHCAES